MEVRRMTQEAILRSNVPDYTPLYRVIHTDECVYHANSDQQGAWRMVGETSKVPPKKSEGAAIMVLIFVTDEGELRLDDSHPAVKKRNTLQTPFSGETRFLLEIGKNRDGYLNSEKYLSIIEHTLDVYDMKYPLDIPVLVVDQSGVHIRWGDDALRASNFNLNDETEERRQQREERADFRGEEVVRIHDSVCTTKNGTRITQTFYTKDGCRRGLNSILREHGHVPPADGKWLLADALVLIAEEEDFKAERSLLARKFTEWTSALGRVITSPKYHPEFNPTELLWAAGKRYTRTHCSYKLNGLRNLVDETFKLFTPEYCKNCFSHVDAWLDIYSGPHPAATGSDARRLIRQDRSERRAKRKAQNAQTQQQNDADAALESVIRGAHRDDAETRTVESIAIPHHPRPKATAHRAERLPVPFVASVDASIAELGRASGKVGRARGRAPTDK